MSNRNDKLEGIKDCLKNISMERNFKTSPRDVVRKFVFFDQVHSFPYLMVLGGDEPFEDELGNKTLSRLRARVVGYAKSAEKPEEAQCDLIEDVLSCLDNEEYNLQKKYMRILGIETDEGMLHAAGDGISMFVANLELTFVWERSSP
jgi:hypothetical protein